MVWVEHLRQQRPCLVHRESIPYRCSSRHCCHLQRQTWRRQQQRFLLMKASLQQHSKVEWVCLQRCCRCSGGHTGAAIGLAALHEFERHDLEPGARAPWVGVDMVCLQAPDGEERVGVCGREMCCPVP